MSSYTIESGYSMWHYRTRYAALPHELAILHPWTSILIQSIHQSYWHSNHEVTRNHILIEVELHCIDWGGIGFHLGYSWIGEERNETAPPKSCTGGWQSTGASATGAALSGRIHGCGDSEGNADMRVREVRRIGVKEREIERVTLGLKG